MQAFRWDSCFITGLATVDDQHHRLVDVINAFGAALMSAQGVDAAGMQALFDELKRYTEYHFSEEEALMAQRDIDPAHIAHHKGEHARFLQDVMHLHSEWQQNAGRAGPALVGFLSNWLAYHILGTDQLMSWLMRARAAGTPAQQALDAFARTRDPATATLLEAMHRLVDQVSERSRTLFELNRTLEARVAERTQALQAANAQLEAVAMTDVLTGLPNRRRALLALEAAWASAQRNADPLALMMIDADGFKQMNDRWGHDAGDAVLRQLARTLVHAVRNDDLVCRLGGDEFVVIAERTALDGALLLAEKVRAEVHALQVPAGAGVWAGSISVGVAARAPDQADVHALLKLADAGVYAAKAAGRNAVRSTQGPQSVA